MSFGRNPHVSKAQAAEQKALDARDDNARVLAWREAARLWDRAAEREQEGKKRTEYEQRAERARATAEGADERDEEAAMAADAPKTPPSSAGGGLLN